MLAGRVGRTQYTFSAEQLERVLRSSAATRTNDGVDWGIIVLYVYRRVEWRLRQVLELQSYK